ncbi:hypothetical protein FVEG_02787 [Fusarium verticillioides 7600]|uniref:Uncharacterized protein n=1 Tax=Gibberella moniliformis (strain M3125 / FGSC 7600) TaxID=334819 RepID=W7LPE6_GIBM7|nr:hypothetical protein FVEG_02787 [Fusarium verticillioides 7600]EWG40356.1 hypothetical protein FVEG_02787 [Fusarium verticillioides 7600]
MIGSSRKPSRRMPSSDLLDPEASDKWENCRPRASLIFGILFPIPMIHDHDHDTRKFLAKTSPHHIMTHLVPVQSPSRFIHVYGLIF